MKSRIEIAREIAEKVHLEPNEKYPEGQKDKKENPYMAHINDVASRVSELGESYEIVGLLHDAIEDAHNDLAREEVRNLINSNFNSEIIEAINAMTKNENEDYFLEYLPRLKKNNIALKVKIADSSHNLSKAYLFDDEPEVANELRKKYIAVLNELGVDGQECEEPIIFDKEESKWLTKTLYFNWYKKPAIIVSFDGGALSYFLKPNDADWTLATPHQMCDYFYRGTKLTKKEFNKEFGEIGVNLPELKEVL
tara:strand:- start:14 stop:769 length:756 start_codon:yes stop_codon:yes gene_type:complete